MDATQSTVEPTTNAPTARPQPIQALAGLDAPLDDAQVRAAFLSAVENNQDPLTATMDDLAQGQVNTPPAPNAPVEVPQKFKKSDGTVDVDKLQASTRQLDEALQQREPVPQKSVDDYIREYQEKEKLFRSGTVPKAPAPSPAPVSQVPVDQATADFEAIVRRDYEADPLGTTTRLLDLMIQKKFQPLEEKEKIEATRSNIQKLAEKDERILRADVYAKINEKLNSDPDLWKLKNPHKAAWLEVKEELRLGEPSQVQAQPSRLTPVLGGGTPPSVPLSSVPSQKVGLTNLNSLDLRDKNQEALGDEAIRRALMGDRG